MMVSVETTADDDSGRDGGSAGPDVGRIVGRDTVLAMTGAALNDATGGAGGLVLISGEPGIGKSAVLTEQGRRAEGAGLRVLRGVGWEGSGAPPFWLWRQALAALPGRSADDPLDALFAVGGKRPAAGAVEAADARFRAFEAVAAALAAAAPVLVLLDDLQWADEGSLDLATFVRRRLANERILLLGAYREGEAGPSLTTLAAAAAVLPLTGLDTAATAAVMAAVGGPVPEPGAADAVRARCGGNPFFVRELTRWMAARGDWTVTATDMPAGIRETLRQRLARLSAPCTDQLRLSPRAGA
jgi:predicted ATPase